MYKHFNTKKPCPKLKHDIDLTDAVKEYVLSNRVYVVQSPVPSSAAQVTTLNQTINIFNQMNAVIISMDVEEKINALMTKLNAALVPYEVKIGQLCGEDGQNLQYGDALDESHHIKYSLKESEDYYELFDKLSRMEYPNCADIAVLYDDKRKKLLIREGQSWKPYLVDRGIKVIVGWLQNDFLDYYECHLIKRIVRHPNPGRQKASEELLRLYYSFIDSFGLSPYVDASKTDDEFFEDGCSSSCEIGSRFHALYIKEKLAMRDGDRERYFKSVKDIVVRNSQHNVLDLNKRLLNLVKLDDDFRQLIIDKFLTSGSPSSTCS